MNRSMGSSMESLHIELVRDILSRVPTLDLLKLSSVCKSWRDMILNDPLFRRLHHVRVMSNPNENLLLLVKRQSELYWVDLTDKTSPRQVAINLPRIPHFSDYDFIGSCNGLLCLVSSIRSSILVMNPLTRHHVSIPIPQEVKKYRVACWGFGYDEVTKLFKVVGVFSLGLFCHKAVYEVRVYDLGSANSMNWRSIVVTKFPTGFIQRASCLFNGRIHWIYYTSLWSKHTGIISFDLAVDKLTLIPTPDKPLSRARECYRNLIVLGECLCILEIGMQTRPPRLLILVMKEYGIKASWVMNTYPSICSSLNLDYLNIKVLGFQKDGELIVSGFNETCGEDIFLSSDLTCDEFKHLQLERQPNWNGSIIHTATLNWI